MKKELDVQLDWVRRDRVTVSQRSISRAEDILEKHLASYGPRGAEGGGIPLIGGSNWWKMRGRELEGEWIEVRFSPVNAELR